MKIHLRCVESCVRLPPRSWGWSDNSIWATLCPRPWHGTWKESGTLSSEHFCGMRLNLIYAQRLQIARNDEWTVLRMRNKSRQDLFRHSCKLFGRKTAGLEKSLPRSCNRMRRFWTAKRMMSAALVFLELNCFFFHKRHEKKETLLAKKSSSLLQSPNESLTLLNSSVCCFVLLSFVVLEGVIR